jgi:hypothetical protein
MTKLSVLSAALMAAAMLATPVAAREHHVTRHYAVDSDVTPAPGPVYYGQTCNPGPRVGAFATQPWDNAPPCSGAYAAYPYPGYSTQGY